MRGTLKEHFKVTHTGTRHWKQAGPPKREPVQRTLDQLLPIIRLRPSPILSLPPEVICEILSYLVHTTTYVRRHCNPLLLPEPEDVEDEAPSVVDLTGCLAARRFLDGCNKYCTYAGVWNHLVIMRVCKRFHAAALAYAPWWQNVMLFNPSIARMCLERSKIDPLYVNYAEGHSYLRSDTPRPNVKALRLVLEQGMPRIRDLSLQIANGANMRNMFTHCESLAAPVLEKLDLSFPFAGHFGVLIPMPPLFDPDTPPPCLRSLRMSSVDLREAFYIFTASITSLALYGCLGPWQSMEDIIRVLTNLPSLEYLSLSGNQTFDEDMSQPFLSSSSGNRLASSLRNLELTASVNVITNFLDCFQFPLSASLSLEFTHRQQVPHNVQRLLEFFTRHFGVITEDSPSFTRALVYLDYHSEACFQLKLACDDAGSVLPGRLCIEHSWQDVQEFDARAVEELACSIHDRLPLQGVQQMRICEVGCSDDLGLEDALPHTFWWRSLARMKDLRDLCLESEPTDFFEWMDDQEQELAETEEGAPFPSLVKLAFNDVDLELTINEPQSDSDSNADETPLESRPEGHRLEASGDVPSSPAAAMVKLELDVEDVRPVDDVRLRDLVTWRMHWQAKKSKLPFTLKLHGCKIGKVALRDMREEMADLGVTLDWREETDDADYEGYDI
ncbi:hypothetical protein PENSPDRAFT_751096, partial [Peniophora sp. CONT]